jgi:hypothetical protein
LDRGLCRLIESKGYGWLPEPPKTPSETLIEPLTNPRPAPYWPVPPRGNSLCFPTALGFLALAERDVSYPKATCPATAATPVHCASSRPAASSAREHLSCYPLLADCWTFGENRTATGASSTTPIRWTFAFRMVPLLSTPEFRLRTSTMSSQVVHQISAHSDSGSLYPITDRDNRRQFACCKPCFLLLPECRVDAVASLACYARFCYPLRSPP